MKNEIYTFSGKELLKHYSPDDVVDIGRFDYLSEKEYPNLQPDEQDEYEIDGVYSDGLLYYKKKIGSKYIIQYKIDLTSSYDTYPLKKNTEEASEIEKDDNALFYQLRRCIYKTKSDHKLDTRSLLSHIFVVDFESVFLHLKGGNTENQGANFFLNSDLVNRQKARKKDETKAAALQNFCKSPAYEMLCKHPLREIIPSFMTLIDQMWPWRNKSLHRANMLILGKEMGNLQNAYCQVINDILNWYYNATDLEGSLQNSNKEMVENYKKEHSTSLLFSEKEMKVVLEYPDTINEWLSLQTQMLWYFRSSLQEDDIYISIDNNYTFTTYDPYEDEDTYDASDYLDEFPDYEAFQTDTPISEKKEWFYPFSSKITDNQRLYFLFEYGISVSLPGEKEPHTFVPFDKSQSMARSSRILFIDQVWIDEMDQRLLLDMDFSQIPQIPSKFLAYKGLYLTNGFRIHPSKQKLDQTTVIVLPDHWLDVPNSDDKLHYEETITYITENENYSIQNKDAVSFHTECTDLLAIDTMFDGEGIIDPDFFQDISSKYAMSTSVQIRMPFIKGMLHQVDFKRFLKEFAKLDEKGRYIIKDAFRQDRDLMQAKIILTESMFKGAKWLKSWIDYTDEQKGLLQQETDPMVYYFRKFRKYDHALYISGTNLPFARRNLITLNYQFLNTLALKQTNTQNDIEALVKNHMHFAQDPVSYLERVTPPIESDECSELMWINYKSSSWITALLNNKQFAHNTYVHTKLENMKKSLQRDVVRGRLLANGEIRFLSRDLLYFLIYALEVSKHLKDEKQLDLLKNELLDQSQFDMPQNNCQLKDNCHYTILRSPHLSRNEACALRFLDATKNGKSIRQTYLGHLAGVLMVSYHSFAPQALGGADFDGDTIKLFADERNDEIDTCIPTNRIRDAVLSSVYQKQSTGANFSKDSYDPNDSYKRVCPFILIPYREGASEYYNGKPDYKTIFNTFSNNVGQISNLAIQIGEQEYTRSNDLPSGHSCVDCTILTGLEIDACKSGYHPDLSFLKDSLLADHSNLTKTATLSYISVLKDFFTNFTKNEFGYELGQEEIIKRVFVALKKGKETEQLADIPANLNHRIRLLIDNYKNADGNDFTSSLLEEIHLEEYDKTICYSNLTLLCYTYLLEFLPALYKPSEKTNTPTVKRYQYFIKPDVNALLSTEKEMSAYHALEIRVQQLILAYQEMLRFSKKVFQKETAACNEKYKRYIFTILQQQYPMMNSSNKIHSLYEEMLLYLGDCVETITKGESILHKLVESEWAYLTTEKEKQKLLQKLLGKKANNKQLNSYLFHYSFRGYQLLYLFLSEAISQKKRTDLLYPIEETKQNIYKLSSFGPHYKLFFDLFSKERPKDSPVDMPKSYRYEKEYLKHLRECINSLPKKNYIAYSTKQDILTRVFGFSKTELDLIDQTHLLLEDRFFKSLPKRVNEIQQIHSVESLLHSPLYTEYYTKLYQVFLQEKADKKSSRKVQQILMDTCKELLKDFPELKNELSFDLDSLLIFDIVYNASKKLGYSDFLWHFYSQSAIMQYVYIKDPEES